MSKNHLIFPYRSIIINFYENLKFSNYVKAIQNGSKVKRGGQVNKLSKVKCVETSPCLNATPSSVLHDVRLPQHHACILWQPNRGSALLRRPPCVL